MKITDENGHERWVWVVEEFDADTFWDGDVHNPREYGETKEDLIRDPNRGDNLKEAII